MLFCLTMVNDAVFQQSLSQVDSFVRLTDLSTLYQPWHKLTGNRRQNKYMIRPVFFKVVICLQFTVICCFCMEISQNSPGRHMVLLPSCHHGHMPSVFMGGFLSIKFLKVSPIFHLWGNAPTGSSSCYFSDAAALLAKVLQTKYTCSSLPPAPTETN